MVVKFDLVDELQEIERVSAVFDVSAEEQCTRRQFPLQMSFGSTVHKCQGLTLDNAIVSVAKVFCPGNIFCSFENVNIRRSRTMLDYDIIFRSSFMYCLKITCLGQCFVACSRVRNISGLHLMDFDSSAVITDPICIAEYNRLRKTIGLGPLDIPPKVGKRRRSSTKQKTRTIETATPIAAVVSIRRPSRLVADANIESEAATQESKQ